MITPSRYRMARTVVPCGTSTCPPTAAGVPSKCGEARRKRSTKLGLRSAIRCCQRSSFIGLAFRIGSHPAGAGDIAQEVGSGGRLREQLADVDLGPPQGLEHEDL